MVVIVIRLPGSDPRPEPLLSRLSGSPRALAAGAGALLIAAVVIVVVLVVSGGSSHSGTTKLKLMKVGQVKLPAADRSRQDLQSVYTAGSAILSNPGQEISEAHHLGFTVVRVDFAWGSIAPDPAARTAPRFDASDPAAYPESNWAQFDAVVRMLHRYHMRLDLVLAPYPPLWAAGKGAPPPASDHPYWEPDAAMFGKFVAAVGRRYSGTYKPKGQSSPLPRVDFWSIWNEPNSGIQLAPQSAGSLNPTTNGAKINVAPGYYRRLADAAWTSLHSTGHGSDTITFGDLAPVGGALNGAGGQFSVMAPLRFLRALYCVDANFQKLRGTAATETGCPSTAAQSARFAADNPVLFHATAFADHPYPQALPPDDKIPGAPDDVVLASLPELFTTLDRLQQVYGSSKRFGVYNLEYGYQTSPPDTQSGYVTPQKAAAWLNWSQYISWRLPRMLSYDQYLFEDPPPTPGKRYQKFATGLRFPNGKRKPTWNAIRMPIWLPAAHDAKGQTVEVWGQVGPAKTYSVSKRAPAEIQFRPSSGGPWKTVKTVSTRTAAGYFDVQVTFPASGSVRTRWTPPSGVAITSRTAAITVG